MNQKMQEWNEQLLKEYENELAETFSAYVEYANIGEAIETNNNRNN